MRQGRAVVGDSKKSQKSERRVLSPTSRADQVPTKNHKTILGKVTERQRRVHKLSSKQLWLARLVSFNFNEGPSERQRGVFTASFDFFFPLHNYRPN